MINAVIFDIDNTLYSYDKAHEVAFQAIMIYTERQLGISGDEFSELYWGTGKKLQSYMGDVAAAHNRLIRVQNMLENKDLSLYPYALDIYHLYWNTLIEEAEPSEGAEQTLKTLREKGIRIGIGTDMTAYMQFLKLEKLNLLKYIDFMVTSEETGSEKPSERFFARCIEKARCSAEECIFVGDSLKKDVTGALRAGMKGIWYNPNDIPERSDVDYITKIPQLLKRI